MVNAPFQGISQATKTAARSPTSPNPLHRGLRAALLEGRRSWLNKLAGALRPWKKMPDSLLELASRATASRASKSSPRFSTPPAAANRSARCIRSAIKTLATLRKLLTPARSSIEIATKLAGGRSGSRLRQVPVA